MKNLTNGINPSIIDDPIARRYWEIVKSALSELGVGTKDLVAQTNYPPAPDVDTSLFLLLAGRSGGQTAFGGTANTENLTLISTSSTTGGTVLVKGRTTQSANYFEVQTSTGSTIVRVTSSTLTCIGSLIANVPSGLTSATLSVSALTFASVPSSPASIVSGSLYLNADPVQVADGSLEIFNTAAPTKIIAFSAASITAGNTRTMTVPDANGTLALTSDLGSYLTASSSPTLTGAWTFSGSGKLTNVVVADGAPFQGIGIVIDDQSGFLGEFQGPGTGLTANRTWALPDASGPLIGRTDTVTLTNKTISQGGVASSFRSDTASSGFSISDLTTSTKRLRFITSGAFAGSNAVAFTGATQAKIWTFPDATGRVPIVGDDPPAVAAGALGKVDLTGQTADIASTNLTNGARTGMYEVETILADTTADVTAGVVAFNLTWTDDVGAITDSTLTQTLIATGRAAQKFVLYVASGEIAYTTTHTGIFGTSAYTIRVRVIYLG